MKKEITLNGVDLQLVKRSNAKRLRIRLTPNKPVSVTVPMLVSFAQAERFAIENFDWIQSKLPLIKAKEKPVYHFKVGDVINIVNGEIQLLQSANKTEIIIQKSTVGYKIFLPNPSIQAVSQTTIQKTIVECLRLAAKDYLPNRLEYFARLHGFKYKAIFIKNLKTRWGSCSAVNNINLNLHLMRLPSELIDYVLVHELQHIRVKNHSAKFWDGLEILLPGAKILDKKLNAYRTHF